jgi:hypothetical protein
MFVAEAQGELINTLFTNSGTVWLVVLTEIGWAKPIEESNRMINSNNFFMIWGF